MKIHKFRFIFHCNLFLRVQLILFHHGFRRWLSTDQATSHYLTQWWLVYWRICASLGLNEVRKISLWWNLNHTQWYQTMSLRARVWYPPGVISGMEISESCFRLSVCYMFTTSFKSIIGKPLTAYFKGQHWNSLDFNIIMEFKRNVTVHAYLQCKNNGHKKIHIYTHSCLKLRYTYSFLQNRGVCVCSDFSGSKLPGSHPFYPLCFSSVR